MIRYVYVVIYWPTMTNRTEFLEYEMTHRGESVQAAYDSYESAIDHAITNNWWPFMVERIEVKG